MRERSQRQGRAYAAIPNEALRDASISMEARGLLALLMTYSDNWTFQKGHLMEITGWGRDKFEKHMGELRRAQYVELVQDRDTSGRVLGSTWIIRDEGNRGPEIQGVGKATEALKNQHPVKPSPGKSVPLRRTIDKEDQEEETKTLFPELPKPVAPFSGKTPAMLFDEFWAAYPKKVGKPAAAKNFAKAIKSGADPERIIEGARRYAKTEAVQRGFVKFPQGWLTDQRWNDADLWAEDAELDPERARLRQIIANAQAANRPQIGRS